MIDVSRFFAAISPWLAIGLAGCLAGPDTEGAEWRDGVYDEGPPLVGPDGKADGSSTVFPAYEALPEGASLDAPFAALFAPDEPVITTELALIERVRAAREADPAHYDEGANPYRIRYAVYNLRNPHVVEQLARAEREGVDVQILIEADQLDPARDYNTTDEYLVERGFDLVRDHRTLDDARRRTADMIGITGSGLMHLKTRLFETPVGIVALSGSMNPGDEAVANDETLHLITDPRLVALYARAYESVLRGARIANEWDDAAPVNVLFTPEASGPRAGTRMLEWIGAEREQILIMVFSLRDITADGVSQSLVQLLAAKAAAGVPVYVITDRKQSDGVDASGRVIAANDRTEDRLRAAGVHVYEATNRSTPFTAMHHKVAILGRTNVRVITDAANWSTAGLGARGRLASNYESQLFIDSAALDDGLTGRRYLAQWMRVLARYAAESEARDREPGFAATFTALSSLAGWPEQDVVFTATAETQWGESIHAIGDHEALGAWGATSLGIPLTTDAATYPAWTSQTISLPVGAPFEWKLIATRDATITRWESGENRRALAIALPLVPSLTARATATWR